jgi:transposase
LRWNDSILPGEGHLDVQMEIEMALAGKVMESFHLKPESFIYDVTSTFVEGEGGAEILLCGYSMDHRPDCRQVNYTLCVTMDPTVPLFHEAFPGNTVDSKTVKETMVRFKDKLGLDGCFGRPRHRHQCEHSRDCGR